MSASLAFAPRRLGRSGLAIAAAFITNGALALAIDQLFHLLGVYPPRGQPMPDTAPNALALAYRLVLGVAAGWIVARLAPHAPLRHAAILGTLATIVATAGAIVAITRFALGPAWYPIALAVSAFPTVWAGAVLHERAGGRWPV